jgi:hypothetical protein
VFSEETWKDRGTNVEQMFLLVISRRGEGRHVYLEKAWRPEGTFVYAEDSFRKE